MSDLKLGPCCGCGREGPRVRNLVQLFRRAPIPGHGWGCIICRLPADGAQAVLCDRCVARDVPPAFACRGYPGTEGRIAIADLRLEVFDHDAMKHAAYELRHGNAFALSANAWLGRSADQC